MATYLVSYLAAHGAFHGHKCEADSPEAAVQHAKQHARLMAGQWGLHSVKEVSPELARADYRKAGLA